MEHYRDNVTIDLGECGDKQVEAVYSVIPANDPADDQYKLHAVLLNGFDICPLIADEECVISQLQNIQFQIVQDYRAAS